MNYLTQNIHLFDLQAWFLDTILQRRDGGTLTVEPGSYIKETPQFSMQERMAVYAEGFFLRLLRNLEKDFPKTLLQLGSNKFEALIKDYMQVHRPQTYALSENGRHLPEFVKTHPLKKKYPFLVALVDMEWQLTECFYSDTTPPLIQDKLNLLSEIDPKQLVFVLDKSLRLLKSEWPLHKLFKSRKGPFTKGQYHFAIHQIDHNAYFLLLKPYQYQLLESFQSGASLDTISQKFKNVRPSSIQKDFAVWMSRQMIKDVIVSN